MTAPPRPRQVQGRQTKRAAQAAGIRRLARYEIEKAEWTKAHPNASPEAYQAAMRDICRRLGV